MKKLEGLLKSMRENAEIILQEADLNWKQEKIMQKVIEQSEQAIEELEQHYIYTEGE